MQAFARRHPARGASSRGTSRAPDPATPVQAHAAAPDPAYAVRQRGAVAQALERAHAAPEPADPAPVQAKLTVTAYRSMHQGLLDKLTELLGVPADIQSHTEDHGLYVSAIGAADHTALAELGLSAPVLAFMGQINEDTAYYMGPAALLAGEVEKVGEEAPAEPIPREGEALAEPFHEEAFKLYGGVFKPPVYVRAKDPYQAPLDQEPNPANVAHLDEDASGGGEMVKKWRGYRTKKRAPRSIFIGDGPRTEDVNQGTMGTCYFLATLLTILKRQPAVIRNTIRAVTDDSVTFRFYHRTDADQDTWEADTYKVGDKILKSGRNFVGLNLPDNMTRPVYDIQRFHNVKGTKMTVRVEEVHETAMWSLLMEKALALFAQKHGKDGTGGATHQSGYDLIDEGGTAYLQYGVFYGKVAEKTRTELVGGGTPAANIEVMRKLYQLHTDPKAFAVAGDFDGGMVDVLDGLVTRMVQVFRGAEDEGAAGREEAGKDKVKNLRAQIDAYKQAEFRDKTDRLGDIMVGSDDLNDLRGPMTEAGHPELTRKYDHVIDHLLSRVQHGRHAYALHAVHLVDGAGHAVDGDHLANADPLDSTVTLIDPHRGGVDMVYTLEKFLTVYDRLDLVKRL